MKKKTGKAVLFVLCCVLLLTGAVHVQAAAKKTGLVTSGKNIYYYNKNGQKVKNCWKTVKGFKYYFGKNGAAYIAPKSSGITKNVVCKKIGKVRYCFNQKGRLVKTEGVYADLAGNAYYVKSAKVAETKTRQIQKALKYLADAKKIRSYLGKPKKTSSSSSCFRDGGTDLMLTYPYVTLALYRDDKTKKESVLFLDPR